MDGATVGFVLTERTTMIVLAIFASLAAIGIMCWLLFTLAVYALPVSLGMGAGLLVHQSGLGVLNAIVIGLVAAGASLGTFQFLLHLLRPTWLRLLVVFAFVIPATIAGYCATFGIVQHILAPQFLQIGISLIGAAAVSATAFVRFAAMAAPRNAGPLAHPSS